MSADSPSAEDTSAGFNLKNGFNRALNFIPVGPQFNMVAFRWLVVFCQGSTIILTWPLWQVHVRPPMLPLLDLPTFNMGVLLLLTLLLIVILPAPGIALHTLALTYAMLIDQTRIQPEFVSLAILMWGTLPYRSLLMLARAHLIALWFFAGLHKFFSPGFINGTSQWILSGVDSNPGPWLRANIGYVIAFVELSLGVLSLVPRTRWIVGWMAVAVHSIILYVLLPTGHNWNSAVWPWNVALALAGFAFIVPWKDNPVSLITHSRWVVRPLVFLLLISPAGFYVGVTDAYLSHNLYSSNTATANSSAFSSGTSWSAFNVPLPPEHRIFRQYFELTCREGDTLTIIDSRWWYRVRDLDVQRFSCPSPQGR